MSKLFTNAEMEALKKWLDGDKSDPTGIISRCVRPKMLELDAWMRERKEIITQFHKKG